MSETDRPADEGHRNDRPAPPGYSAGPAPDRHVQPDRPDPATTTGPDGADGAPYYGRVTRYGPATPAAPPPSAGWPPPAAWPSGAVPPPQPAQPVPTTPPVRTAAPYAPVPGPGWGPVPAGGPWVPPGAPAPGVRLPHGPRRPDYAPWIRRVLALVVDHLPSYVASGLLLAAYVPLYAALLRGDLTARPTWGLYTAGLLLSLAAFGFTVWNRWFLAGRTGQSLGKRLAKIWLVGEADGRPVGTLTAFLRDLLHVLDGWSYVGYLWPLWDDQRQTLADKIAETVVVTTPVAPLPRGPRA